MKTYTTTMSFLFFLAFSVAPAATHYVNLNEAPPAKTTDQPGASGGYYEYIHSSDTVHVLGINALGGDGGNGSSPTQCNEPSQVGQPGGSGAIAYISGQHVILDGGVYLSGGNGGSGGQSFIGNGDFGPHPELCESGSDAANGGRGGDGGVLIIDADVLTITPYFEFISKGGNGGNGGTGYIYRGDCEDYNSYLIAAAGSGGNGGDSGRILVNTNCTVVYEQEYVDLSDDIVVVCPGNGGNAGGFGSGGNHFFGVIYSHSPVPSSNFRRGRGGGTGRCKASSSIFQAKCPSSSLPTPGIAPGIEYHEMICPSTWNDEMRVIAAGSPGVNHMERCESDMLSGMIGMCVSPPPNTTAGFDHTAFECCNYVNYPANLLSDPIYGYYVYVSTTRWRKFNAIANAATQSPFYTDSRLNGAFGGFPYDVAFFTTASIDGGIAVEAFSTSSKLVVFDADWMCTPMMVEPGDLGYVLFATEATSGPFTFGIAYSTETGGESQIIDRDFQFRLTSTEGECIPGPLPTCSSYANHLVVLPDSLSCDIIAAPGCLHPSYTTGKIDVWRKVEAFGIPTTIVADLPFNVYSDNQNCRPGQPIGCSDVLTHEGEPAFVYDVPSSEDVVFLRFYSPEIVTEIPTYSVSRNPIGYEKESAFKFQGGLYWNEDDGPPFDLSDPCLTLSEDPIPNCFEPFLLSNPGLKDIWFVFDPADYPLAIESYSVEMIDTSDSFWVIYHENGDPVSGTCEGWYSEQGLTGLFYIRWFPLHQNAGMYVTVDVTLERGCNKGNAVPLNDTYVHLNPFSIGAASSCLEISNDPYPSCAATYVTAPGAMDYWFVFNPEQHFGSSPYFADVSSDVPLVIYHEGLGGASSGLCLAPHQFYFGQEIEGPLYIRAFPETDEIDLYFAAN